MACWRMRGVIEPKSRIILWRRLAGGDYCRSDFAQRPGGARLYLLVIVFRLERAFGIHPGVVVSGTLPR